jgi:predicted nucleic acid-binding protein
VSQFTITAILDACVLYSARLRSLLMHLARTEVLWARWTEAIHEEWMRSVRERYPDITRQQLEHIRDLMNEHAPDCIVSTYEDLIPGLTLPDPDDRHVLAAAIRAGADVIVTFNLADFPPEVLAKYDIEALHPDDLVDRLLDLDSEAVCAAVKLDRLSLKKPPKSVDEYLEDLQRQGLLRTVGMLRRFYLEKI